MVRSIETLKDDQKPVLQPTIRRERLLLKSDPKQPKGSDSGDDERTPDPSFVAEVTEGEGDDE
jgi:hypothetical protein